MAVSDRSPPESSEELLDVLPRRSGLELDAGVEQVVGRGEAEPALAPGEEHGDERLEVPCHVVLGGGEDVHDLRLVRG